MFQEDRPGILRQAQPQLGGQQRVGGIGPSQQRPQQWSRQGSTMQPMQQSSGGMGGGMRTPQMGGFKPPMQQSPMGGGIGFSEDMRPNRGPQMPQIVPNNGMQGQEGIGPNPQMMQQYMQQIMSRDPNRMQLMGGRGF